jgi:transcriptional regulator with XRE-family HTH domain
MYSEFANALITANSMSQEKLAEMVGVSREMISKYYCGTSLPSADKVQRMAEVLNSPMLMWEWLRANPIGRELLPKLPNMPLSQAFSYLYSAINKVADMHRDLVEITKDNRIEPHEYDTYQAGREIVRELVACCVLYKMAVHEKSTPARVL